MIPDQREQAAAHHRSSQRTKFHRRPIRRVGPDSPDGKRVSDRPDGQGRDRPQPGEQEPGGGASLHLHELRRRRVSVVGHP